MFSLSIKIKLARVSASYPRDKITDEKSLAATLFILLRASAIVGALF